MIFDRNNFNTAIAAVMELCNATSEYLRTVPLAMRRSCDHAQTFDIDLAETIVKLLAPIAPHWAEELWRGVLGHEDSVHVQPWPQFDPEQAKADEVELAVQGERQGEGAHHRGRRCREDEVKSAGLAAVETALAGKDV